MVTIKGVLNEAGSLESGRGIKLENNSGNAIEVVGLSESDVKLLALQYGREIEIKIAPPQKQQGFYYRIFLQNQDGKEVVAALTKATHYDLAVEKGKEYALLWPGYEFFSAEFIDIFDKLDQGATVCIT